MSCYWWSSCLKFFTVRQLCCSKVVFFSTTVKTWQFNLENVIFRFSLGIMLFRNLLKQSPKRERGEQKSKYYSTFQGAAFLYKNKFKKNSPTLPTFVTMVWDALSQPPVGQTHTDHRGSLSLLNSFSPTSSGELLLYSLPHSSFLPLLIYRLPLGKHAEENKKFFLPTCFKGWANSNQQIFCFLYWTSSLAISYPTYFEKSQSRMVISFPKLQRMGRQNKLQRSNWKNYF